MSTEHASPGVAEFRRRDTAGHSPELAQQLRFAIARLARLLRQQDRNGYGPTLTAALASVARHGSPTHGELAALEQVAPPTITAVVTKMEALGLVTRESDPNDRRVTRILATAAGLAELDAVRSRRTEWLELQMAALSDDELSRLAAAADVLTKLTVADDETDDLVGATGGSR